MTAARIARLRARTQGLAGRAFPAPESVVSFLGAVQAQEYALAKWSVGMRCGARDADVEAALADGRLLRTHVLRPTWHFVTPADIGWMLALTGPRVLRAMQPSDRRLELDAALYTRARRAIAHALRDGAHRTRAELGDALGAAGIAARGQRLAHIVMHAELAGDICSGAPRGRAQTYALLAERAPPAPRLPRAEAAARLAHRYFRSHGPATLRDFRWWSGLSAAEARDAVASLGSVLESFDADGRTFFLGADSPATVRATTAAHLLQAYDESIVAYTESRDVLDPDGIARHLGRAPFVHAIVRDGRLVGRWRPVTRGRRVRIDAHRAGALPARALDAAAARYGAFLGVAVEVAASPTRPPRTR